MCDAFWNSIDYESFEIQFKSRLNFFDIGCGSGRYGNLIKKFSKKSFNSYTGLDLYKNEDFPIYFTHILDRAENSSKYINEETNFVMSQSSLEHIEQDLSVIHQVTDKLIKNKKPFVQIHLIPAARSLWLYLWHGWRQYSKNNLINISKSLNKKFKINTTIVPLCGNSCFWTHLKYITLPTILKKLIHKKKDWQWSDQVIVEEKIYKSVLNDIHCKSESPIFWALIIKTENIEVNYKPIHDTRNTTTI